MAPRKAHQVEVTNRKNPLHQEPTVINQKLIRSSLRALLPKGEEGLVSLALAHVGHLTAFIKSMSGYICIVFLFKYARELGVNERTAEFLLIEFQSIAQIANISHMVALKKLKLSNNVIHEINGLDTLVNLSHLDLSFNCIKKIENIDKLVKLESLNLHRNFITTIENMDNQLRLEYFIISSNGLNNPEDIKYLRRLPRLRMLVVQANPFCEDPKFPNFLFRQFILTCLPELAVLDYEQIPLAEKLAAQDPAAIKLARLSVTEAIARRASVVEAEAEQMILYTNAYVDGFFEDELWKTLYQHDEPGQILLQMNEVEEIRSAFQELFRQTSMELFNKGMIAFRQRKEEYNAFQIGVKETKDDVKHKGQKLTEEFTTWGRRTLREMRHLVLALDEIERNRTVNTSLADEHSSMAILEANRLQILEKNSNEERLHKLTLEYVRKLHHLWYTMMTEEVELNEQMVEVGQDLATAIQELVHGWEEQVHAHFAELRDVEQEYYERLVDVLITNGDFEVLDTTTAAAAAASDAPEHLQPDTDKDALEAIVQQSHEHHDKVITEKEELMVTNLNNWLESAIASIRIDENGRSRQRICELSHYADTQYAQLHKFKILKHIQDYHVPELRADQNEIPVKTRKSRQGSTKSLKSNSKSKSNIELNQTQSSQSQKSSIVV